MFERREDSEAVHRDNATRDQARAPNAPRILSRGWVPRARSWASNRARATCRSCIMPRPGSASRIGFRFSALTRRRSSRCRFTHIDAAATGRRPARWLPARKLPGMVEPLGFKGHQNAHPDEVRRGWTTMRFNPRHAPEPSSPQRPPQVGSVSGRSSTFPRTRRSERSDSARPASSNP